MTVIDFIDVIDDIIDLSSDEETDQQDHIVTQPRATLLDRQDLFVLADERRQDAQDAFVSAVEESQAATEFGNAVATALPSVTEKAPLHTAESQNSSSFPTAPFPSPICTTPKVLSSEVGDTKQDVFVLAGEGNHEAAESGNALAATASPSVMEKEPLDTVESKDCPSSPTSAPLPSLAYTTPKALTSEVGEMKLFSVKYSRKNYRSGTHMAESQNCPSPPTAPFPGPTSTTPMVLHSEVGDTKQDVFVLPGEGNQDAQAAFVSAGEGSQEATESENALVATALPSILENVPLGTAESRNCPSFPTSAPPPSQSSTNPKALTCGVGDTKPVIVRHPKKNYHTDTLRRSPRFDQKRECFNSPVEELAADPKRSRMLDPAQESAAPNENAKCEGPASTTPNALTFEVGDTKPVRVKVKHPMKSYHTSTPRRSPRFEQKGECCNSHVEELAADHKRSQMLDPAEELASPADNAAQSTKILSTDLDEQQLPAVVDFIDVIGDIIDLTFDEETVQQDHIVTQPQPTLLYRQAVFVLDDERRQDAQAALVSALEGSQAATESGNALVATASPSVMMSLDMAESENCPSSPTSAPVPNPASTIPKALFSEVGDTKPVRVKVEHPENYHVSTPRRSPRLEQIVRECCNSGVEELVRAKVKHPKKNYHTSTPRRSPRLEQMLECCNSDVEDPAANHKRSRLLDPAEESAVHADNVESTKDRSLLTRQTKVVDRI